MADGTFKKVPPPPPSIGSSTGDESSANNKGGFKGPPAPSIAASKRTAMGMTESTLSKRQRKELDTSGVPRLTPEQKRKLAMDQNTLRWLDLPRNPWMNLKYDNLILKRNLNYTEAELYVDTTYCRGDILKSLMDIKYQFKDIQKKFFTNRNNLSLFDKLFGKDTWYMHSDFIKAANIDALMDFQLSQPRIRNENMVSPHEVLYFADIYDAPGGFAEYLLWKRQWSARGFGFTEKENDWRLPAQPHYPTECFETIYGFHGLKGKGDINDPKNVDWYMKYVRRATQRKGCHVVIANGGDSTESGDEDKKELRCKYLLMAEAMIALEILRDGGHFVMRVYDMFTPFTNSLVLLLHQCFDSITIHKPETSLYASSERYLLCKGKKSSRLIGEVHNFLLDTHATFVHSQRIRRNEPLADIRTLLPNEEIKDARDYMHFIQAWNGYYGGMQLEQTERLVMAIKHEGYHNLLRTHQDGIRAKALKMWGIPKTFSPLAKLIDTPGITPEIKATKLVAPYPPDIFVKIDRDGEQELNFHTQEEEIGNPLEWHLFLVGRDRGFFLGMGGQNVYRFHGSAWVKVTDPIELAANTLVYGDIVDEIIIHENKQITTTGLQIMDAMMLGGKDIRGLPHNERLEQCSKYSMALDKQNRDDLAAIRAKRVFKLSEIEAVISRVVSRKLKGGGRGPTKEITYPCEHDDAGKVFKPSGVLLMRTTKENLIPADFLHAMQNRLIWRWQENVSLELENQQALEDAKEKHGPIHAATLIQHVNAQLRKSI